MDKEEFRIKLEEINNLVEKKDYKAAMLIVDSIDWRRVKNVRTLCTVGEIYAANKRYEDSREIFLLAYHRASVGKTILYRLIEVCIKMSDFDEAIDYYNEFVKIAPNDNTKYILQYKIHAARKAPIQELIQILEYYKEIEYTERWAYELAKLYYQANDKVKCIETCDELSIWFSDGKYVVRALELKQRLTPLSASQMKVYENYRRTVVNQRARVQRVEPPVEVKQVPVPEEVSVQPAPEKKPEVKKVPETEAGAKEMQGSEESPVEQEEEPIINEQSLAEAIEDISMTVPGIRNDKDFKEKITKGIKDIFQMPGRRNTDVGLPEDEAALVRRPVEGVVNIADVIPEESFSSKPEGVGKVAIDPDKVEVLEDEKEIEKIIPQKRQEEKAVEKTEEVLPEVTEEEPEEVIKEATGEVIPEVTEEEPEEVIEEAAGEVIPEVTEEEPEEVIEEAAGEVIPEVTEEEPEEVIEEAVEEVIREETTMEEFQPENLPKLNLPKFDLNEKVTVEDLPLTEKLDLNLEDTILAAAQAQGIEVPEEELVKPEAAIEKIQEPESPELEEEHLWEEETPAEEFDILSEEAKLMKFIDEQNLYPGIDARELIPRAEVLDDDEIKLFTYFAAVPGMKEQLVGVLKDTQMAASDKTSNFGNVIIMGNRGCGKTMLFDCLIKAICRELKIPAAKTAKVEAQDLNGEDIAKIVNKLSGGFLLIHDVSQLNAETVEQLNKAMEFRTDGLTIILEDEKIGMRKFIAKYPKFIKKFTSTISIPVFTNDELVNFAKVYTKEMGYKIEDMGILALYSLISDNQKEDEPMTVDGVKIFLDNAIAKAESGAHKLQRKLSKTRTDNEGYVVLYEKDFK